MEVVEPPRARQPVFSGLRDVVSSFAKVSTRSDQAQWRKVAAWRLAKFCYFKDKEAVVPALRALAPMVACSGTAGRWLAGKLTITRVP